MSRSPRTLATADSAVGTRAAVLLSFAIPLAVYLRTLHPGLPGPDSGELITVARILGVAHPPGYPLWTLIAHGFGMIVPFGAYAWRMNVLSALMQAGATAILCAAVIRLTGRASAGLAATLGLAFARAFWKSALVAEVFPLNDLMAALLWLAFASLLRDAGLAPGGSAEARSRRAWPPGLLILVTAAIPAHHHTLVLLAVPIDAVSLALMALPENLLSRRLPGYRRPYALGRADFAIAAGIAGLGLAPLAYLPFAAAQHPALNWGTPDTWPRFTYHLLRTEYGTLNVAAARPDLVGNTDHARLFLRSIPAQLGVPAVALIALGAIVLALRAIRRSEPRDASRPLAVVLTAALLLEWLFLRRVTFRGDVPYLLGVVERFYPLPELTLAVLAGLGCAAVLNRMNPRWRAAAGAALVALAALPPLVEHFRIVDQRGNHFMDDLSHNVLASLPRGAVLLAMGDEFYNGLNYVTLVERERTDVTPLDPVLLKHPWYAAELRRRDPDLLPSSANALDRDPYRGDSSSTLQWIDHLIAHRPVAFLGTSDSTFGARYELVRRGFVSIAAPIGHTPGPAEQARAAVALLDSLRLDSYSRRYDPVSSDAANRGRTAETVAWICFMLCDREGQALRRSEYPSLGKLATFLDRFEREPAPDPVLLWGAGYLHAFHPDFHDPERAANDLERYLAFGASGPEADGARRLLETLHQNPPPH